MKKITLVMVILGLVMVASLSIGVTESVVTSLDTDEEGVTFMPTPTPRPSRSCCYVRGDINCDHDINFRDVALLLRHVKSGDYESALPCCGCRCEYIDGIVSADGKASVTIKGAIKPPSALPVAPPSGVNYVGYAYDFEYKMEISIEFDSTQYRGTPVIYIYEASVWKPLETKIVGNKATATVVDQASPYVLFDVDK